MIILKKVDLVEIIRINNHKKNSKNITKINIYNN